MSLGPRPRLELRQSHQLAMTPQLRQAIAMLQMSTVELTGYLADQVEANPLLALDDGLGAAAAAAVPESAEAVDAVLRRSDLAAGEAQFVTGRENLYEGGESARVPRSGGMGEAFDDDRWAAVAGVPSLPAHVDNQLCLMRLDPVVARCARAMAGELDEAGYLRATDDEIAGRLGVSPAVVADARAAVQACEPTGIGARALAECLALQLRERDRLDPAMQALLAALPDLPTTPAVMMARRCGVDLADLRDMLAELRSLDPRPGLRHGGGTAAVVVPDVIVEAVGGAWRVVLNTDALPRLLVDNHYAARLRHGGDRDTRAFIAGCSQNASWLRRSLDQRAQTILAVATEIVRVQTRFFERGVSGLSPLTLRTVAEAVGVHESTVSRVTANKFMATPRGVLEMKFFFGAGLGGDGDTDAVAAEAVRERIRSLVAAEKPGKPLSDDQLVRALKAEGIEVARRTVAKYRDALHIPSSVERRRRAGAAV